MKIPIGVARFLYVLGIVLMLLAIVDALLSRAKIDLTGVTWLPLALGCAGMVLMWVSRLVNTES